MYAVFLLYWVAVSFLLGAGGSPIILATQEAEIRRTVV
jgi:hypothetical protein